MVNIVEKDTNNFNISRKPKFSTVILLGLRKYRVVKEASIWSVNV